MKQLPLVFLPIRSADEAKKELAPHLADLVDAVKFGFAQWEKLGAIDGGRELRAPLGARERASFIYCHIVQEALRRLQGRAGVILRETRRFLTVFVNDTFVVRFKKLDKNGRASNYQTKAHQLFALQTKMPGLDEETRITIGYQLNELATALADILVVCPKGRNNVWAWSAVEQLGTLAATTTATPIVPFAPTDETELKTEIEIDPSKIQRHGGDAMEAGA